METIDKKPNTRIISLEAENIKRLKVIHITPEGNLIGIGGSNGEGKSSTLDAIEMALAGGKSIPTMALREGEEKGHVILETESLVITRTFTPSGSKVVVADRQNGLKLGSPQAILDKLTGDLTFDPLNFSKMKDANRTVTLQKLIGLDFTKLDEARKEKYDERTFANKEVKSIQAKLADRVLIPDAPTDEVDVAQLSAQLMAMSSAKNEYDNKLHSASECADGYTEQLAAIEKIKEELSNAQAESEHLKERGMNLKAELDMFVKPDTEGIQAQITNANNVNNNVRNNLEIKALNEEVEIAEQKSIELSVEIDTIDDEKDQLIHEAPMPIDGLGFGDDGVTFRGIPFEQCSGAETLRISVAMGMALNPELNVLLIRDGSLLDEKSLAMVAEMATAKNYQVWMERVGEGAECQVILEDGMIK